MAEDFRAQITREDIEAAIAAVWGLAGKPSGPMQLRRTYIWIVVTVRRLDEPTRADP
jgi:hypothetical protein